MATTTTTEPQKLYGRTLDDWATRRATLSETEILAQPKFTRAALAKVDKALADAGLAPAETMVDTKATVDTKTDAPAEVTVVPDGGVKRDGGVKPDHRVRVSLPRPAAARGYSPHRPQVSLTARQADTLNGLFLALSERGEVRDFAGVIGHLLDAIADAVEAEDEPETDTDTELDAGE